MPADEVQRRGARDINDLFRNEIDITVRAAPLRFSAAGASTGWAGNEGINIRGLEGKQVLLLIDGIRVPNRFSFGAFATGRGDFFTLDSAQSLEVLRGPASTQFGSAPGVIETSAAESIASQGSAPGSVLAVGAATPSPALTVAHATHSQCALAPCPPALKEQGIEGVVQLRILVNAEGRAAEVQVLASSGRRLFDQAALAQARGCRFVPASCCASVFPVRPQPQGSQRRRLWHLDGHAHCAIVGVCLPVAVLRQLADKLMAGLTPANDYELHCCATQQCKSRTPLADAVQRDLDRRYASFLRRAAPCKTSDDLLEWWLAYSDGAELPGALWAVGTHARCAPNLEHAVLAEMHMMQHQDERVQTLQRALTQAQETLRRGQMQADVQPTRPTSNEPAAEAAESAESLSARAALCVGGRSAVVPVYRRLVESRGGRFSHHDGGDEDNVQRLDAMLSAADLVICQTGCISHNACWRVKDHCKRTGKRCLFVDNPSAASLRRALGRVVSTTGESP